MAQIPMSTGTLDAYQQHDPEVAPEHPTSTMAAIHNSLFEGEVLDGVYRGSPPGIRMLGITNRRLIMLEDISRAGHLCFTSIPLTRLSTVSFMLRGNEKIDSATSLVFRMMMSYYELHCHDRQDAREAHDLVVWHMIA
jgi:hypothetical protein